MKLLSYDEWFNKFEQDLEQIPLKEGETFENMCDGLYTDYKKSVEEFLSEYGEFNRHYSL